MDCNCIFKLLAKLLKEFVSTIALDFTEKYSHPSNTIVREYLGIFTLKLWFFNIDQQALREEQDFQMLNQNYKL